MPKRTREEDTKPAPRLSAVAQRRLREQQAEAASPAPTPAPVAAPVKAEKPKSAAQRRQEQRAAEETIIPEPTSADELARKRSEIEKKIAQRVAVVQAYDDDQMGQLSPGWDGQRSPAPGKESSVAARSESTPEESALARIKREQAEKRASGDEDVEMRSTEEGDEDVTMDYEPESAPPKLQQISTFVPTTENYRTTETSIVCRLQPGETLVLVGIYRLKVKAGSINFAGAVLSEDNRPQTVYAPMTHALPVIEAPSKRKKSSGDRPTGAEVEITNHHSGLSSIGKICPPFSTIWKSPSKDTTPYTFTLLFTSTSSIPLLTLPATWKPTFSTLCKAAASPGPPPVILIAGSKGAGKSTFSRVLTNRLLAVTDSVAYLDLDPGQPEFTPPGLISLTLITSPLFGPSYTHTHMPTRAHHIGYTSPREDPGHYIRAILNLVSLHRATFPEAPLIINTAGWTKGLGLELLAEIMAHSETTHTVFLGNASALSDLAPPGPVLELPLAAASTAPRFAAADLRALATTCHLHRSAADWDFSAALTGMRPWVVGYAGPSRGVDAAQILGEAVAPAEVRDALEGTVVGVVLVAEEFLPETLTAAAAPGEMLPLVADAALEPDVCECVGLAVVRVVDVARGEVQLLMGLAEDAVDDGHRRVVLVRGRLELPVWEMLVEGKEVPWVERGGKGGAVWRVRRNVMRRAHQ